MRINYQTYEPAALDGIRIFDLSRLFAGNTSANVVADHRAEMIKVDRTGVGYDLRKTLTALAPIGKSIAGIKKASPSTYAQTVAVTYSLIWRKQPM